MWNHVDGHGSQGGNHRWRRSVEVALSIELGRSVLDVAADRWYGVADAQQRVSRPEPSYTAESCWPLRYATRA